MKKEKNFSLNPEKKDTIEKGLNLLRDSDLNILDAINGSEATTDFILQFSEMYSKSTYVRTR